MRRFYSCLFYGLCVFAIAFSLFWMAQPALTAPSSLAEEEPLSSQPAVLAQAEAGQASSSAQSSLYYLCDEGGRVAVYACGEDGEPLRRVELTTIYVNLLPEGDALRIKAGLTLHSEKELGTLLEDLGQ